MTTLIEIFKGITVTQTLDLTGSLLSLLTVYLATNYHRSTWLVALCAICVNGSLYFQQHVWGHFSLDIFYAISSLYGWHHWKKQATPRTMSLEQMIVALVFLFISTAVMSICLIVFKGNAIAFDALGTCSALLAQILTCLSFCESWPLWVMHDLMNLAIDFDRNLFFHAIKECIYLWLAYRGWKKWHNLITKKESQKEPLLA